MNRAVGLLLLAASAAGCAQVTAALPPWLRPGPAAPPPGPPPPSPVTPPQASPTPPQLPTPSVPGPVPPGPATPMTAPPPPAPPAERLPAPPPAPVVSPRTEDEDRVTREVSERLAQARRLVAQIDPAKLAGDQREIFTNIQDFLVKAGEALSAKDLPRARILADKASKLADDLAAAVNKR